MYSIKQTRKIVIDKKDLAKFMKIVFKCIPTNLMESDGVKMILKYNLSTVAINIDCQDEQWGRMTECLTKIKTAVY